MLEISAIRAQIRFLQFDIDTILDAALVSETQRSAVKSVVQMVVDRRLNWIDEISAGQVASALPR